MKPNLLLIVSSVLVIVVCLYVTSIAISGFRDAWDPCSLFGGAIMLPVPLVLTFLQYYGTFRQNFKGARGSAVLLFIVSGFSFFAFVVSLGEILIEGIRLPWMSLLLPMLGIGVVSSSAAWLNLR